MERRTAVITGASKGLGLALARRLAAEGWSLVIDARHGGELDRAAATIDGEVVAVAGDVTDPAHRRRLAAAAQNSGNVRLLVNNASTLGVSPLPALDAIDLDTLRRVYEVNVVAPVALVQALAPHLAPGAVIVNVSSDAAIGAYETWGGYGSSKAALDQVSNVLAAEHADWQVYAVDPGDMRTEMHQAAFPGEDISDRPEPDGAAAGIVALIESGRPSGRYEASVEVAR